MKFKLSYAAVKSKIGLKTVRKTLQVTLQCYYYHYYYTRIILLLFYALVLQIARLEDLLAPVLYILFTKPNPQPPALEADDIPLSYRGNLRRSISKLFSQKEEEEKNPQ